MKTIITKLGKTHYTQHYTKLKKKRWQIVVKTNNVSLFSLNVFRCCNRVIKYKYIFIYRWYIQNRIKLLIIFEYNKSFRKHLKTKKKLFTSLFARGNMCLYNIHNLNYKFLLLLRYTFNFM